MHNESKEPDEGNKPDNRIIGPGSLVPISVAAAIVVASISVILAWSSWRDQWSHWRGTIDQKLDSIQNDVRSARDSALGLGTQIAEIQKRMTAAEVELDKFKEYGTPTISKRVGELEKSVDRFTRDLELHRTKTETKDKP